MDNMSTSAIFRQLSTGVASGTSNVQSAAVDTRAVEGVVFAISLGTFAGATSEMKFKVQQSDKTTGDWDNINHPLTEVDYAVTVPNATGDLPSDELFLVEVLRTRQRYIRLVIDRATAASAIRSIVAILYGTKQKPVKHHSTVVGSLIVRD